MTKEDKLLIETRKRMQKLYEYSFFNHGVFEDGEDQNQNAQQGAQQPQQNMQGGSDQSNSQMGGDPNAMGGGMQDPMGGDPNAMGDNPNMPGPDDNVIDISEFTDSQDEMKDVQDMQSEKLEDVDKKLTSLMQVVSRFTKALDANDEKLRDLKRELVKRTPTEEETMNVRLEAGGNPFNQKPNEFWNKFKDINNHYNITSNNEAPQYQIRKGDIDNFNDRIIDKEFDDLPSTLKEYFTR